jgi:hypothetical protein
MTTKDALATIRVLKELRSDFPRDPGTQKAIDFVYRLVIQKYDKTIGIK